MTAEEQRTHSIIALAHKEFRVFLQIVWAHMNLPKPTRVQLEMADYLQYGGKSILLHAFRGVGKSFITAAYVLWCLWNNPKLNVLVVSASGSKAHEFSQFCKRLITEMPLLRELRPRADQRDAVQAWDVGGAGVSQAPSVKSVGITGQLTGSRADIIVADDIEVLNNSLTADQREKLLHLVSEFESILKPGGCVKFLGTPQSVESIYNKLRDLGYQARFWTARIPEADTVDIYAGCLAPSILEAIERGEKSGTPVDPERFNDAVLSHKEAKMGRSNFRLQFQLNTTLSDADRYPLKTADLIIYPLDRKIAPSRMSWAGIKETVIATIPNIGFSGDRWYHPVYKASEMQQYTGTVMAIDPSGRGADETSYAVVKHLNGLLFVMDVGGFSGGYEVKTLENLMRKAHEFGVNEIIVESNFSDGMFESLLSPVAARIHPCSITGIRNTRQKELRILDTLEPLFNGHRLIFDQSFVERSVTSALNCGSDRIVYNLFYQITRLTRERNSLKHDDKLDALAMACQYFIDSMAQDAASAEDELRERLKTEALERFVARAESGLSMSISNAPVDPSRYLF